MAREVFYEEGDRAILLLHSFTSHPIDFYSMANTLRREGYTVYAPIFSGHDTKDPDTYLQQGITTYLEDGREAVRFLQEKGYKRLAVFGLSLGGMIATRLMIEMGDELIAGGTFCSPVVNVSAENNVPENFQAVYKEMKGNLGYSETEAKVMFAQKKPLLNGILDDMSHFVDRMIPAYETIELPVFIAQGGQDKMISIHSGEAFKDELVQANVDYHFYPDAPHQITVGRSGKELLNDFVPFLNQLDWSK